ncbi:MAG TPA: hypothetical protein VES67_23720 [Vicinamibacterales bacterium]|nr:hypothetical protein [Vicinamibacterales bacterium]
MRTPTLLVIWALAVATPVGQVFRAPEKAAEYALIDRAIEAAGGTEALKRSPAFVWKGEAQIHVQGRDLKIVGTWSIDPPDKAIVETRLEGQAPEETRTLVINGKQGFSIVKETREQLAEEVLENERDEFYLYSLMRLLPLLDSAVRLAGQPKSEDGLDVIRVSRPERPDVDLFFDADARLRRLSLETLDPVTNTRRRQNVKLDGELVSRGIRWFKNLTITWENEPYFELTILTLDVLPGLTDPRLR